MLPKYPQRENILKPAMDCESCCFFRLMELESMKVRKLCMITGEKRPNIGMSGCQFIPGQWSQVDRILDLPKSRVFGNSEIPNQTKPGNGFFRNERKIARKDTFAIDDFFGNPINHIPGKGSLARLGYREAQVARLARERA